MCAQGHRAQGLLISFHKSLVRTGSLGMVLLLVEDLCKRRVVSFAKVACTDCYSVSSGERKRRPSSKRRGRSGIRLLPDWSKLSQRQRSRWRELPWNASFVVNIASNCADRRRQEYVSCIDINQVSAGSAKATFGNKVTFQVKLVCQNVQLC